MGGNNKFIDKFSNVAMRVGGQIHLKALRDTFATIMPLYILAGVAVLINNVVLPLILKGNALVNAQYWGTVITNGTLNISGLLVAPIVAYMLSQSKRFENPLAAAIIALITCELFINISHVEKLQIMEDTYEYLSNFLRILYGVLDPEIFILSGSVALKIPGFEGEERYINEEGSNCFGYHACTGIDCWSWNNAYKNRYGFIALDLETQKRTVKKSGEWLRKVTEEHGYIAKDSYQ